MALHTGQDDRIDTARADRHVAAGNGAGREMSLLHSVLDASPDCIMLIERDENVSFISENGRCAMSLDDFELLSGTSWVSLYPDAVRAELFGMLAQALRGIACQAALDIEWDQGRRERWMFQLSPVPGGTTLPDRVLSTSRPIPDAQTADLQFKEADHRIKNSLSSIASLLRMQARAHESDAVRAALDAASERILSIGSLHGHIHASPYGEGEASVPLKDFLSTLATDLVSTLTGDRITVLHEIDSLDLPARRASAVGLIVTEAITNALRHGIGDDPDGGMIHVKLDVDADRSVRVAVTDTGTGWPPDFDWSVHRGVGGRIMSLYARSLGGRLACEPAPHRGARLALTFDA